MSLPVVLAPAGRARVVPVGSSQPDKQRQPEAGGPPPTRIGILGGTFDPPHIGHLWLATLAADALPLDQVVFMPAALPPHKRDRSMSSITDRLLMTRTAIKGNDAFELSTLEVGRPGPSFTIDSVEELRRAYGAARLFLLMASDSLAQIDSWREPDRLLSLIEWAVAPRPGSSLPDGERLRDRFGAAAQRIHLLEGPSLDVSATEIRRRVAAGRAIRYLVPQAVEELILEKGLYRRSRRG
ncbi:MAG TPA: nicotinate-nucleotide adenylyltransferase [Candidatus Limnocylindrales bacterium]|nr:nicotinate-nucleotide adenylyltransferase [Candidatus Limnocylindrales bacterium]